MRQCPNCGFENKDNAKFCMECGENMEVLSPPPAPCPECGAPNEEGSKFCEKCGASLEEDAPPDVPEVEEPEPPVSSEKKKEKIGKKEKAPGKEKPEKPPQPKIDTVTVVKMKYPQNEATKIARKQLLTEGKLLKKKKEVIEAVLLKYLPLLQSSFDVEKKKGFLGMKGKETEAENLYFHGLNGKLLQVTDKLDFSDITQDKAERIKDFDGIAEFEQLPENMIPKGTKKPRITEDYVMKKIRKMFGAVLKKTKPVYLPVFKFKIVNKETRKPRLLWVDTVFGIPSKKNPFK